MRVAVHPPLEGPLQPGASLSGTLDFRAGREGANGAAAPRCSEVSGASLGPLINHPPVLIMQVFRRYI